jgi:hypothetical protein
LDKFRKKTLIELVGITEEGYLVQNEGDSSDQWVIDSEIFETTYEKLEETKACCIPDPNNEYLLLEILRIANLTEDYEFRSRIKAKLEDILGL